VFARVQRIIARIDARKFSASEVQRTFLSQI
jgi:hypothetical protein